MRLKNSLSNIIRIINHIQASITCRKLVLLGLTVQMAETQNVSTSLAYFPDNLMLYPMLCERLFELLRLEIVMMLNS